MTANEFLLWMKGFASALGEAPPDPEQWEEIRGCLCQTETAWGSEKPPVLWPSEPPQPEMVVAAAEDAAASLNALRQRAASSPRRPSHEP